MTWARFYLGIVVAGAVATSYWTVYHWVLESGGDHVHAIGTPLCLEAAALAAARAAHRKDRWAYWVLGYALVAAVAINVAYGLPSLSLALAYGLLPPVMAIAIGVLFVREIQGDEGGGSPQPVEEPVDEPVETRVDTPAPAAHTNGHKPHTRTPSTDELAALIPDTAAMDALRVDHGSIKSVCEHFGVTRDQLNAHRRKIGDLK